MFTHLYGGTSVAPARSRTRTVPHVITRGTVRVTCDTVTCVCDVSALVPLYKHLVQMIPRLRNNITLSNITFSGNLQFYSGSVECKP